MNRPTSRCRRALLLACAALAACAHPPPRPDGSARPGDSRRPEGSHPASEVPGSLGSLDYLLLGEVHDNPEHHRRRLEWLERLADAGRFALALEQLDAERQPAIDAARATGLDARALAQAASFDFDGWPWLHYGPFVAFALRRGLPLIGANLSAADVRRIARGASDAAGADGVPPGGWRRQDQAVLEREIVDGHCGLLPESAAAPMALAQRSRDARMARALVEARRATGLPVVLLAGNGHVRRDVGVPRHLEAIDPGGKVLAVGVLERAGGSAAASAGAGASARDPEEASRFDRIVLTAPHRRDDPCEELRRRFAPAGR